MNGRCSCHYNSKYKVKCRPLLCCKCGLDSEMDNNIVGTFWIVKAVDMFSKTTGN